MEKRYIVTIKHESKNRLRVTVVDQKLFRTLHDYKTQAQFKNIAITTLRAMYGDEAVFVDKTDEKPSNDG